jgi:membrane-bound serine protease (ClpP class)
MHRSSVTPSRRWPRLFAVSGCLLPSLLAASVFASPIAAASGKDVGMVAPLGLIGGLFDFLVNPNGAFLMLMIGGIGIYLELSHPGAIAPGVVGAIALVLFLLAAAVLPINLVGLLLIGIAFVFLVLDVRLPSHGVLTVGALISLVLGALLAFDDTGVPSAATLNPLVLAAMTLCVAAISGTVLLGLIRSRRRPVTTGKEAMIGQVATVTEALTPAGQVKLQGEIWAAKNFLAPGEVIEAGQRVRVMAVKGLTLYVAPLSPPDLRHIVKAEEHLQLD